ncbi:MAG: hypothetical protein CML73_02335 [Rhodobiaceae bacterium]|nr:hypothetical protein [Rhodobiaceae bacterium]
MALEDLQRTHNRVITELGNISASNDPVQVPHDLNEKLIKGAAKLAAGEQLGLSQDETLAIISRMSRRQKHKPPITENQALARLQQVSKSLADVSEGAELRGTSVREDAPVDPFGQNQSQYYEYREGDTRYDQQEISKLAEQLSDMEDQDSLGRRRYERGQVRLKTGVNPGDYDEMADMLAEMKPQRDDMTPKVALQQALAELEASGAAGTQGYAQVAGALEDDIALGRTQRAADASIAGEMVRRDSKDFNAEAREANYYRAETDALQERRRMYGPGGYGMDGDINFALMRTKPTFGQITQRQDGAYIDENGNTVAVQGPERAVMGSNTPSNSQALNAPTAQSAQSWVAGQTPDYYDGGRTFGDLQQVDITGTTTEFADRIRGMEVGGRTMFTGASPQVRSIDELQAVVNAIVRVAGEEGVTLGTKEVNPNTGRMQTKRSANPGAQEVMNLLRYTPAQQERIASALYQLGASKSSGVDNEMKRRFFNREEDRSFRDDVTFGAVDAMPSARPDESQAQIARIRPGQTVDGRDIATQLRNLQVADARKPFIGAVIDPSTGVQETNAGPGRITRFNRSGATGEDIAPALRAQAEERSRRTGKPVDETALQRNTTKARLTDERARRDAKKRQERQTNIATLRGPAPSEPNPTMSGPAGYGDALRRVTDDAREQSSNMELSDLIREIRRGRTR